MSEKGCDRVTELSSMKNIGKEIEKKLQAIGIRSGEELLQIGSKGSLPTDENAFPKCLFGTFIYTSRGD